MLDTLDILIGVSLVMLMVSLGVTLLTEMIVTLLQLRGQHLLRGIADLLQQIQPDMERCVAQNIVTQVLNHRLVRGSRMSRLASVIKREELTTILMELAGAAPDGKSSCHADWQTPLKTVLATNGIPEPRKTLDHVRDLAFQFEKSSPEMATSTRHNMALMNGASSEWVSKVNAWFDQTMDRVSERFTVNVRGVTLASAAIVACGIQLDTVYLVNRLALDDNMRHVLVAEAVRTVEQEAKKAEERTGTAAPPAPAVQDTTQGKLNLDDPRVRKYYSVLSEVGILNVPSDCKTWWTSIKAINPAGLALSILLLSLGGPFWYGLLNKLLQLRSVLAQREHEERAERQTTQAPAVTGAAETRTTPAVAPIGERGNVAAVG